MINLIMNFSNFTIENESQSRNKILLYKYKKIPSYALWDPETIEKENVDLRLEWWTINAKEITNNSENTGILEICNKWKYFLAQIIKKV